MELTLKLKGLMQSYGGSNPWTATRRTELQPTITAVRGLIECALGLAKVGVYEEDDVIRQALWKKVDIEIPVLDHMPEILSDDQIVGALTEDMQFKNAEGKNMSTAMPQITKEYIVGECFTVVIKGDDDSVSRIKEYLKHPIYPYCLGRACCIPSEPIVVD